MEPGKNTDSISVLTLWPKGIRQCLVGKKMGLSGGFHAYTNRLFKAFEGHFRVEYPKFLNDPVVPN